MSSSPSPSSAPGDGSAHDTYRTSRSRGHGPTEHPPERPEQRPSEHKLPSPSSTQGNSQQLLEHDQREEASTTTSLYEKLPPNGATRSHEAVPSPSSSSLSSSLERPDTLHAHVGPAVTTTSRTHLRHQSLDSPISPTTQIPSADPRRRESLALVVDMPLTGDGRTPQRQAQQQQHDSPARGGLAGWWSGNGTPLGAEDAIPNGRLAQFAADQHTTPTKAPRRPTTYDFSTTPTLSARKESTPGTATTSRFSSFLASPMSALSRLTQSPTGGTGLSDDELLTLNIDAALFPTGEKDAFSPAAFKNLQANAMGLLMRFQNAYRTRTLAVREMQGERTAQVDELDEAQTRVQLLKLQLEDMARKAAEQEDAMKLLANELAAEKKSRAEERLARQKSLPPPPMSEGGSVSEDLGVEDDQRLKKWRKSIDTDEDESIEDASLFSRSRSPTIAPSIFEGSVAGHDVAGASAHPPPPPPKVVALNPPSAKPRSSPQQMSMFQKVLKGISGDGTEEPYDKQRGCRNCKGRDASVAWDTVSLLRDENKGLKHRVAQLESCVESALDVVNGVGL